MAADLVQRLRTCPPQERKYVALEIANRGTKREVKELYRMAEGLPRKGDNCYGLDDQLIAIMALAERGTQKEANYLSKLYSPTKKYSEWQIDPNCISFKTRIDKSNVRVEFPHARGMLREALRYKGIAEQKYAQYNGEWSSFEGPQEKSEDKNSRVHSLLEQALRRAWHKASLAEITHPARKLL
jgi:hypothetical protein